MIRGVLVMAALCGVGLVGGAQAATPERQEVLECIETLDTQTNWNQCLTLMFAPCADLAVGSDLHVGCLGAERVAWRDVMDAHREALFDRLTPGAADELSALMDQWLGYVGQRCNAVAEEKAEISAQAAQLGCEISEIVGATAEFAACRRGESSAPYCILQE